ncbi:MAG: AraC family transcriptional regulator [Vicinamibacterales bacterium]
MASAQHSHYWQPPAMPGVSALAATFTNQHFVPHAHDALVIAVTEAGGASYTSRGTTDDASPAALLVFNPREPHAGHMRRSRLWRYRALYLEEAAITRLLDATGLQALPGATRNALRAPALIEAFRRAHAELESGDPELGRERLIDACGRLFAALPAPAPAVLRSPGDRRHVDTALRRIREEYRSGLTVDGLAAAQGLSPFQLVRQFKRHTGMPPRAHLLRARLHHAIGRLRAGWPIGEAAVDAGFYDQSALTRHFRRAFGITPGQYVRARAGRP